MAESSDEPGADLPRSAVEVPGGAEEGRAPTDQSLSAVLTAMEDAGWRGQLSSVEGGTVRCVSCGREFRPGDAEQGPQRRLEGVSDPADMLLVVGLRCPHCHTDGVLVATYGPEASAADSDVVAELPD